MPAGIDHLVVTAPDLASGAEYVRRALGVAMEPGGEHPPMGTHNLLLKLGPDVYLEVIAKNPAAPDPGRPRWFELDRGGAPRLATWAVHTSDIRTTAAAACESPGDVLPMTRGTLKWHMTVPRDGLLGLGGVAPALIEWPPGVHPAVRLPDSGCSLVRIEAFHPDPARVSALLASIGFGGPVSVQHGSPPRLVARIETPEGMRTLGG
jgi:Glyoxalase-like domain